MQSFLRGQVQLLVCTTVIEVGVDVANASLMVIESAERFGLAQLHQLRGRIGRGAHLSECVLLFAREVGDAAARRLAIMKDHADGFTIADLDLEMRGEGEYLGERQSGQLLRFADLRKDEDLLQAAREAAPELIKSQADAARGHVGLWIESRQDLTHA